MSMNTDFFHFNELLLNMGSVKSPAELQGMLCGRLCGSGTAGDNEWETKALAYLGLEHLARDPEPVTHLKALYARSLRLLEDVNYTFTPLLPGDESSLHRRTEELGFWCQGFLHGIASSGLKGEAQLSSNVADALRDLAQISQVAVGQDDDLEENEVYWQELVEYVKVAVLTIYTERLPQSVQQQPEQPSSLQDKNRPVH